VLERRGTRYDPAVVAAFVEVTTGRSAVPEPPRGQALPGASLRPGLRLTRDLVTRDGSLLLSADHVLSARLIAQIADFEKTADTTFTVYVRIEGETT
jgi:hypothetical protein